MNEVQKVVLEQKLNKRSLYFSHPFSRKMSFFIFCTRLIYNVMLPGIAFIGIIVYEENKQHLYMLRSLA